MKSALIKNTIPECIIGHLLVVDQLGFRLNHMIVDNPRVLREPEPDGSSIVDRLEEDCATAQMNRG